MNGEELETFRKTYSRIMEESISEDRSSEKLLLRAIRETHVKDENSCQLLCYMGAYIREKTNAGYINYPTYDGNYNFTYKTYIDVETEKVYDVENEKVPEFEATHAIVYPKVIMNNLQERLRGLKRTQVCFYKELMTSTPSKALKVVLKEDL